MKSPLRHRIVALLMIGAALQLAGCSNKRDALPVTQGGISGVFSLEKISSGENQFIARPAALLGLYVTDFLSAGQFYFVLSALNGIEAQTAFAAEDAGVQDEDYALLQAFADALNVDLAAMLNRSVQRDEALNRYTEALHNVAGRAVSRHEELDSLIKSVQDVLREKRREASALHRKLRDAFQDKDFSEAGTLQEAIAEKEAEVSDAELKLSQLQGIDGTLEDLLDIYEKRSVAIANNREALISGITVVDVPGAKELEIIEKPTRSELRERAGIQIPKFGN